MSKSMSMSEICGLSKSLEILGCTEPISAQEEYRLGMIILKGGPQAEKACWDLALGNALYLAKVVIKICKDTSLQEDIFDEALRLAVRAAKKFDATMGKSFVKLFGFNLEKELISYKQVTFGETQISAYTYKMIDKYKKLNAGREAWDQLTVEEFAKIAKIKKLENAKEIVFLANNGVKSKPLDVCYGAGCSDDADDCFGNNGMDAEDDANDSNDAEMNYSISTSRNFDFEVMLKRLDAYLDNVLTGNVEKKKHIWMSCLGINCAVKDFKALAEEYGCTATSICHTFNDVNRLVEKTMPSDLRDIMREQLGY